MDIKFIKKLFIISDFNLCNLISIKPRHDYDNDQLSFNIYMTLCICIYVYVPY